MNEKALQSWTLGFAPQMSKVALESLLKALRDNDPRLIQGATTQPPPLQCVMDWPVERTDAIGFAFWLGEKGRTVREVEEAFAKACFTADQLMGEPAGCRYFLNWWDDTPRDTVREELAAVIEQSLAA